MPKVNLSGLVRDAIKNRRYMIDRRHILLLDDNKVAKKTWIKESALKEFNLGSLLHGYGVRVPMYFDVVSPDPRVIRSFLDAPVDHYYIVMQRINGRRFQDLETVEKRDALEQYKDEIFKAQRFGIVPENWPDISNCLYEEGKLYLIDFSHWTNSGSINPDYFVKKFSSFYSNIRESIERLSEPGGI